MCFLLYHMAAMSQISQPTSHLPLIFSTGQESARGELHVDLSDIIGRNLPGKVLLRAGEDGPAYLLKVPEGSTVADCPAGEFTAYVYVYELGVPMLVDVREITVEPNGMASLPLTLTEGSAGHRTLLSFDADHDLVLDRLEEEQGTDRFDAASMPGVKPLPTENVVLSDKPGWYKGELHARSNYSLGSETVEEMVRRAEKADLDFLAITDRNTMDACQDPDFTSDNVVLIPAMEWGDSKRGYALIYGPRTIPERADTFAHAQALMRRVQMQGGIFAIAHPCFRDAPWQWGLQYVNAIQVWCRDWRSMPPVRFSDLDEDLQMRGEKRLARDPETGLKIPGRHIEGKPVYPIARAAATTHLAANAKAELFWDAHLKSGLRVSPIGGSMSSATDVPMGRPVTYVYAYEKSLAGILTGLRQGRTFISVEPDGPTIDLFANVTINDRTIYVPMGGIIPIGKEAQLVISVRGAKGKKVQVFADGRPIISKTMDSKKYDRRIVVEPDRYTVFRARVVETAEVSSEHAFAETGLGTLEVLALSSPIYAENLTLKPPSK
ncbi:MAG: CehA/McbA family metallohydrolase, partial [Candidatus Hydrogenedentota bacterium]